LFTPPRRHLLLLSSQRTLGPGTYPKAGSGRLVGREKTKAPSHLGKIGVGVLGPVRGLWPWPVETAQYVASRARIRPTTPHNLFTTYHALRTMHCPKQPPSGGFATTSPKGEADRNPRIPVSGIGPYSRRLYEQRLGRSRLGLPLQLRDLLLIERSRESDLFNFSCPPDNAVLEPQDHNRA